MWRIVMVKTKDCMAVREPDQCNMFPDDHYKLKRTAQSEADVLNHPLLRGKKPQWHYRVEKVSKS